MIPTADDSNQIYASQVLRRIPMIEEDSLSSHSHENDISSSPSLEYCSTIINNNANTAPHFLNSSLPTSSSLNINSERQLKLRHKWPPYLISVGGSGNSYIRLMIEYVTQIYTGAIYDEPEYQYRVGFEGKQCTDNVIIVKAHTAHIMSNNETLHNRFLKGECVCNCDKKANRRSGAMKLLEEYKLAMENYNDNPMGNVKPELLAWMNVSAVFLIRDPWKAAWSTMQMLHGEPLNDKKECNGCKSNVDDPFFNIHTRHLPMIGTTLRMLMMTMYDYVVPEWLQTFELMELFDQYGLEYIVMKLEDFTNKDESVSKREWDKLFGFLLQREYFERNYEDLRQRFECAKVVGDRSDRMRLIHRKKTNISDDGKMEYYTIETAYNAWSSGRICSAWDAIKDIAEEYGYEAWNKGRHKRLGTNCEKY